MTSLLASRSFGTIQKKSLSNKGPNSQQQRFSSVVCEAHATQKKANVKLTIPFETKFGQSLCVAGAAEELGSWREDSCLVMNWQEGNMWTADCQLPAGSEIEYKYILKHDDGSLEWQPGSNVKLELPKETSEITAVNVHDCWLGVNRKVSFVENGNGKKEKKDEENKVVVAENKNGKKEKKKDDKKVVAENKIIKEKKKDDKKKKKDDKKKKEDKKKRKEPELPELSTDIVAKGPVDIGAPEDVSDVKMPTSSNGGFSTDRNLSASSQAESAAPIWNGLFSKTLSKFGETAERLQNSMDHLDRLQNHVDLVADQVPQKERLQKSVDHLNRLNRSMDHLADQLDHEERSIQVMKNNIISLISRAEGAEAQVLRLKELLKKAPVSKPVSKQ